MNNLGSFQAKGDIGQIERIQRREVRFNSGNYSSREEDATRRLKLKVGSFRFFYIYGVDVVEWYRALDVRLSEWCCSVSMV
jgi:hypothetical protein